MPGRAAGLRDGGGGRTAIGRRAGWSLSRTERARIEQVLGAAPAAGSVLATPQGTRFVLHDTDGHMSDREIAGQAAKARGPLGEGAAAYVPRTGEATIARPRFFDPRRPTISAFEKAGDKLGIRQREDLFRRVWKDASGPAQSAALSRALEGLELSAKEQANEAAKAKSELAGGRDIHTTATWAVGEVCAAVAANGPESVASKPAKETDIRHACALLEDNSARASNASNRA